MKIKKLFSDGHPQKYHVAALVFAMLAMSLAVTTTLLAEETANTSSTTTSLSTTTAQSCSYSYSDWTACQPDGKRSRTVTSISPSGCVQTSEPDLSDSCSYTAPTTTTSTTSNTGTSSVTAPQCEYSYSDWNMCQSTSRQTRTLLSKSPYGCQEYTRPFLERSCTYTAPVTSPTSIVSTTTTTTTATADQCLYTYGSWGTCQSNGKRTRSLLSKSPTSCQEYTRPVLEQSCIYDDVVTTTATPSSTTSTSELSGTSGNVTPTFSFVNINDGMAIQGTFEIKGEVSGAQGVEYYLVPAGSNTYKYIGSGSKVFEKIWSFTFRSREFPNGEFYLRAKIKNIYGEYGGGQRKIRIANESQTVAAESGFVSLEKDNAEKIEILQKIGDELQIPKTETAGVAEDPKELKKYIFNYCQSNPAKCFPERDSDKDGLSDVDEIRYGTDPKGADSDLDGFIDGDEIKNGFDPLKYSSGDQGDRIIFENPKIAGETKSEIYAVQNVELKKSETDTQKLQLSGKGLPNSFVTIYVYSDPIVLTVKTDSEGNWTYELDKELENGEHEAYVAITDNTGKITAKSEPLSFVKTAQAVTVIPSAEAASSAKTLPVTQTRSQRDLFLLMTIIISALAVALATIGLVKHNRSVVKEEIIFK